MEGQVIRKGGNRQGTHGLGFCMRYWGRGMRREDTHDPGHHGPLQDQTYIPLFGGLSMVFPFFPRPGHKIKTICPGPSLLPSPNSCLGPQRTPTHQSPLPVPLV